MAMNMDAMLRIKADVQGENNIRRLGNSMQGLQGQVKNAALGFNSLKGAVAGFGAAIAGSAIVGGLTAVVKKSIDAGDELFNLQQKTGMAANTLIAIGNAAKLADVDMGTLGKGINKLSVNIAKAASGNEELAAKFSDLGVRLKDSNGQLIPTDRVLKQLADRFADMPDGAQKAAAAVALFGKSGAELIPLLNEGATAMEKFTYKVSDDFAARSDKFNDTITELGISTRGFGLELTDALLPSLQSILEVFAELFDSKQDWTALFDVIKVGVRSVATVLYALVKLVDEAVKLIGSFAKRAQLAFSGDFAGAVAEANRYGSGFMDRFGSNMTAFQRIWSDSASPGTGRRTRGSGIQTTDLNAQREAEREALKAQRDFNQALDDSADLAADLRQRIRDLNLETSAVGQSARQAIETQYQQALNTINDDGERLLKTIKELKAKTGGAIAFEGLANSAGTGLAQQYLNALGAKASKERAAALGDLDREDMLSKISAPAAQDGFRAGIDSYVQSLGTLRDAIRDVTTGGFQYLEDAIVNLTMTGKFQFKDFALSIVSDLTRMVTRMLILAPVMQLIQSLLPGSRMFSGGFLGRSGAIDASGMRSSANFGLGSISGNYFANGGIVNSPTFFRFANGGAGNLGLMGEAGPEGILPLKRGRDGKLGVAGGGGTNITVNVDAKGTSVQGDQAMGGQLARVVAGAVQAELIKQKRPGGMLA
jgi:lambda family phage tail tape measure protein